MLETFLPYLPPKGKPELDDLAVQYVDEARQHAAPYRQAHRAKARIHTWLPWQDPPGRQLHEAVKEHILTDLTAAQPFLHWFCKLYELQFPARSADST